MGRITYLAETGPMIRAQVIKAVSGFSQRNRIRVETITESYFDDISHDTLLSLSCCHG